MSFGLDKFLAFFSRRGEKKPFSAWQIELTTRCPLACKMCIRRENDAWQNQDIPFDSFRTLLPYLKDVETVILEGWGESLLYPHLTECIRLIKKEGPRVGFVTSGKGLNRSRVSEIVEAGLDFVGFSIAGTTPRTHDAIRVNSQLSEIFDGIRLFNEERVRQRIPGPKVHLVFLMVKDNIAEVPEVPALAKELGVEEVFLTNICHTINTWQEEQKIFGWDRKENPYEKIVKKAENRARSLNIKLKRPFLTAEDVPVCEENPLRNLYISAQGYVSPCVYLHPPLPSPFKRIFCGREQWVEKLSFGNAFQVPFSTIWSKAPYVDFRSCFLHRQKKSKELFLSLLEGAKPGAHQQEAFPEPPDPCKSCHKLLGL
jgi:MoaA/NifB/PqqE/SkfB family radical SAM enzyme